MIKKLSHIVLIPSIIVAVAQAVTQLGIVAYPAPVSSALNVVAWILRITGLILGIAGWLRESKRG